MKRHYFIGCLLLMLSIPMGEICAEKWLSFNTITKHYIYLSGGGGYYSLLENIPEVQTRGGGAGMLGLGYEFRYKGFWFSLGGDVQYGSSAMTLGPDKLSWQILDTQGKQATAHYDISSGKDVYNDWYVGVPFMLGFYTNGFYMGVGAKFAYDFRNRVQSTVDYTISGEYERYLAEFTAMPNHYYTHYTTHGTSQMSVRPQWRVMGELGYDILNNERMANYAYCSVLKLAAYVEVGVTDYTSGVEHDQQLYMVNNENTSQLIPFPYYANRNVSTYHIFPFYAGVKLTYMMRIKTARCKCENW